MRTTTFACLRRYPVRLRLCDRDMSVDRFYLDVVNADQVTGWCLDADARIEVSVEGRRTGAVTRRLARPDVALVLPHEAEAGCSGFVYNFRPEDFAHAVGRRSTVEIRASGQGWQESRSIAVAWPSEPVVLVPRGPFPSRVLQLLVGLDADLGNPAWSDEQMLEATRALEFLALRGSKTLPGLHRYLAWTLSLWTRARYAELNFPRVNHRRLPSDKDGPTVQSSGFEMLAIGHHLLVLDSHGVGGAVLEFGCFKGFSTSVLSLAAHDLRRSLHVFDSFEGLPPSEADYYQAGDFAGGFEEVHRNVAEFGTLAPVTFHKGFFTDSVPAWPRVPIACLWMDVDLESSARDALRVFDHLDARGVLFSHECAQSNFDERDVRTEPSPMDVVAPIIEAFRAAGRRLEGRFVAGNTGAFWAADVAAPVLSTPALEAVRDLALRIA